MEKTKSHLWVLDDHDLRRAGILGFIAPWVQTAGTTITEIDGPDGIGPVEPDTPQEVLDRHLCIYGIGGRSLRDPDISRMVQALLTALNGRPLVVISDLEAKDEITFACQMELRGLIPTQMHANVAVAALDFIMSGGRYFPVGAGFKAPGAAKSATSPVDYLVRFERSKVSQLHNEKLRQTGYQDNANGGGDDDAVPYPQPNLTPRQTDVLQSLTKGQSNKEIARTLHLSEATVKIHVRQLMKKYGAMNRTQVALRATVPNAPHNVQH